jgi:hypothetical protein
MGQAGRTRHPLYAMTTYELRDRRSELEEAIKAGDPGAALREDLAAVLAEEDQRASIRRANGARA